MQTPIEKQYKKCTLASPDRMIVATDLSDAGYLVPHAIAQAKAANARVTLIHAVSPTDLVPLDAAAIPYVDGAKIMRDVRLMLLGIARQFEAEGIACDVVVRGDYPAQIICDELNQNGATRVIMGTHGRGKLGQFTLGSVAHELISRIDVPVFVVGSHARAPEHESPKRILHPVSLTGEYRESVQFALDLAQANQAELTLLHVFDGDIQQQADPDRRADWAKTAMQDLVPDEAFLVAPVHFKAAFGKPAEQILKEAKDGKADWIVMGVDREPHFWKLKETTAYRVITAAACPVLTLRHQPSRGAGQVGAEELQVALSA